MNIIDMLKELRDKLETITVAEETSYIKGVKDLFYLLDSVDGKNFEKGFKLLMDKIDTGLGSNKVKEVDTYNIVIDKPLKVELIEFVQDKFENNKLKNEIIMGIINAEITDTCSMKKVIHEVINALYEELDIEDIEVDIREKECTDTVGNKVLAFDITVTY